MGQFLNLSADQQLTQPDFETHPAGMRLAASQAPLSGTAVAAAYRWATVFPQVGPTIIWHAVQLGGFESLIARSSAASAAGRLRGNAYLAAQPEAVRIADPGLVTLRRRADLGAVAEAPGPMTTSEAARLRSGLESGGMEDLELVAAGVVK
jgi:hypothetical protein